MTFPISRLSLAFPLDESVGCAIAACGLMSPAATQYAVPAAKSTRSWTVSYSWPKLSIKARPIRPWLAGSHSGLVGTSKKGAELKMDWREQVVLVTGGTGSFGRRFTKIMLEEFKPKKLIIFSRDELKQMEMRAVHDDRGDSPMRYFIGDVRDRDRLVRAMNGVT